MSRAHLRARLLAAVLGCVAVLVALSAWISSEHARRWVLREGAFDHARLELGRGARAEPLPKPAHLRAFYSGHSLSDGVPEEVLRIAESKGKHFDFEVESLPGSLIRERVARRAEGAPPRPGPYDVQVVTERHDLPYAARFEQTARELAHLHRELVATSPGATTFFYHTWLEIDLDDPQQFIRYERHALPFWECVASAANAAVSGGLVSDQSRVRVLPGATALAELVERLLRGDVAGVDGVTPRERVQSLFTDRVHPSPVARYFMGAVHYAALFGESPGGASVPLGVSPELGAALQEVAWQHVSSYEGKARAASLRDMALCRDYATQVMCPLFTAHPRGEPPEHPLRLWRLKRQCQEGFADPSDHDNPFQSGQ